MSAQKTGKNAPSLPVPPEEEEEAPGGPSKGGVFGDQEVAPTPAGQAKQRTPLPRQAAPGDQPSEFSDAVSVQIPSQVADWRPQALLHLRRRAELGGFLVLRSGPPQSPSSSPAREAGALRPSDAGDLTGVRELRPGRMVGHLQAVPSTRLGRRVLARRFMPIAFSVWDGFSRERGNRRGLTLWYSLYVEPETVPSAVGPMVRTALVILAIELAVIGWVRWRYASGARGEPAVSRRTRQPLERESS